MKELVDSHGAPLRRTAKRRLTEEVSAPTLTGVRSLWAEPVASGLTPGRLAKVLRESAEPGGDTRDYLTLCEEMEEREPHYRSVLSTRKLALRGIDIVVEAASEEDADQKIADEVEAVVKTARFRDVLMDLADGIAKGYAVCEIVWETAGGRWTPARFPDRDPRHFQFDQRTGRELRLRADGDHEGEPLEPFKYLIHIPKLKSGMPIRAGLARTAAWIFMLKSFTLKDWMAFLEVYGMPFRVGRYGPGATADDKRALLRAVAHIAADGGAIIPRDMLIEFIEAKGGSSGENAFQGMSEYLDAQLSKLALGQTMTSDDGSSLAQAEVHNEVRLDIKMADADMLAATTQRDLVEPYVMFNHGRPKNGFPQVTMPVVEPEDVKALMSVTKDFVDRGGKVGQAAVRDRLGLPDPDEEDELLRPMNQASDEGEGDDEEGDDGAKRAIARLLASRGRAYRAAEADALEEIVRTGLADWEPQLAPVAATLRRALEEAGSYEAFAAALEGFAGDADLQILTDALAAAGFTARVLGRGG